MVDEADVDVVGMLSRGTKRPLSDPGSPRPNNRRKPGPLPKDYTASRGSLSPRPVTPTLNAFPKSETPDKMSENEKPLEGNAEKNKSTIKNVLGNSQKNPNLNVLKNSNFKNNAGGNLSGVSNCTGEVDGEEMEMDVEVNGVRGRCEIKNYLADVLKMYK